jgi:CBS domain-containing protein
MMPNFIGGSLPAHSCLTRNRRQRIFRMPAADGWRLVSLLAWRQSTPESTALRASRRRVRDGDLTGVMSPAPARRQDGARLNVHRSRIAHLPLIPWSVDMLVSEIMTSPVLVIEPSASIAEAARIMLGGRISGLPVVGQDKRLVGVLTEGDFLRRGELATLRKRPRWLEFFVGAGKRAEEYVQTHGRRVEDVMSPQPVTIAPGASLEELIDLMTSRKIKRVPVVDNGELVGVVARSDVMRAVLRALPASSAAASDDERTRKAVAAELARHSWSAGVRVTVTHGTAELSGVILDERARTAARVAAENVPGVAEVVDELCCIEPVSGMYLLPPGAMHL